jgi:hypothetical protein
MARSEARLQFGIWRGLEGHSAHAKLLYPVLLTEPTLNQAGFGAVRIPLWARNASLTVEETEKALAELGSGDPLAAKVLLDEDTEEFLIRTLIRNDKVFEQPFVLKGACTIALQLGSPFLRWVLAQELRKLPPKQPDGVSKSGKPIVYADPHGTADVLDPPGSHPPAFRDPFERVSRGSREGLAKQEGGQENPRSAETLSEGSRDPVERERGRGRGRGRGEVVPVEENSTSTDQKHTRAKRETAPAGFDEFWDAYPRRTAKRAAQTAYVAAVKRGAEPAEILTATRRFATATRGTEPRFIPHPATWLNQGRYDDDPSTALAIAAGQGPTRVPTTTQRVQAALSLLDPEES